MTQKHKYTKERIFYKCVCVYICRLIDNYKSNEVVSFILVYEQANSAEDFSIELLRYFGTSYPMA